MRKQSLHDLWKEWRDGVRRVTEAYELLPEARRDEVRALCASMVERKEAMQALAASADAASVCADCGGACCVRGKYHFTAVDLIGYLAAARPLFTPLFDNGLCPYLAPAGCLMAAGYRPFNCITFNCEKIEDRLPTADLARFYQLERALRQTYREIRTIFPAGSADGSILQGAPLQVTA